MKATAQYTPNPNAVKFTAEEQLFEGAKSTHGKAGDDISHPLLKQILALEGVDSIMAYGDFVSVNKVDAASWDTLEPAVLDVFATYGV
ncbi:NifU N-terminal domain-containing protein [Aureibacillus halotolerans]|uniref:Scaffold Nfu/NifU family protein n=1 Tax=Aureibacillus halotolerans TaxID=1508390 RepID=A0A4R6U6F8_9BACI|nr:NifU N-terminal domain-containing protein [Aureibacillus halotolerans]TDQ42100.1 scaffold Nfu/NifU family protein [Aureibacillus halotolerans]